MLQFLFTKVSLLLKPTANDGRARLSLLWFLKNKELFNLLKHDGNKYMPPGKMFTNSEFSLQVVFTACTSLRE